LSGALRADEWRGGNEVTFDPGSGTVNAAGVKDIDASTRLDGVCRPPSTQCTAVDRTGEEVTLDPGSPGNPTPSQEEDSRDRR